MKKLCARKGMRFGGGFVLGVLLLVAAGWVCGHRSSTDLGTSSPQDGSGVRRVTAWNQLTADARTVASAVEFFLAPEGAPLTNLNAVPTNFALPSSVLPTNSSVLVPTV